VREVIETESQSNVRQSLNMSMSLVFDGICKCPLPEWNCVGRVRSARRTT